MRNEWDGRRLGERFHKKLDVELHVKGKGQIVKALDVSRHGMFLATDDPPKEQHVVLLTVHLPDAPFETMAIVARRVETGPRPGVGVKLYCLASDAKARWDHFIEGVSSRDLSLTPLPAARSQSASFLVQLESCGAIEAFFKRHVLPGHIVHVTPALKHLGAEVLLVFVHPETSEELVVRAEVAELDERRPLRMGVRFLDVDRAKRLELRRFLASGGEAPAPPEHRLVAEARSRFTEYAFYSPRVAPTEPPVVVGVVPPEEERGEELATVEGELLELEELQLVDPRALFDFAWQNES